ncbi:MAG: hypothetical protein ACYCYP_05335 [Leptospirales bacterium]
MTPSPSSLSRSIRSLSLGFLCVFGLFGMTSCGGGPDVSTSTGTTLYVGSTNGIYAFSLQSNNVLKPVSSKPLVSGTVYSLQYVQSPGGSGTPTLYAATGATSITTYTFTGGGGLSAPGTLTPTGTCLSEYTGVTATPDGNWLLAVDGDSTSTNNLVAINLKSNNTCSTPGTLSTYPISVAVDCPGISTSCDILVSTSTTALSSGFSPSTPQYFSGWTTGTNTSSQSTLSSALGKVWGAAFSRSTSYFYLTVPNPGQAESLLGGSAVTSTSTYSALISNLSVTVTSPCADQKNNLLYVPTSNGTIYQISINTTGGLGSPNQIWNSSSASTLNPAFPTFSSCTIQN